MDELNEELKTQLNLELDTVGLDRTKRASTSRWCASASMKAADEAAAAKVAKYSPDIMRQVEKSLLLQAIDSLWRDHLVTLDHLSKVVGWRGLAQRDPLNEYKSGSL